LRLEKGNVGEILTVIYPDGSEYQTAKITRMRFEKMQAPKPEPKAPEQGDQ
jgi:ribosomal protein L25 (general stress protein Ctc)